MTTRAVPSPTTAKLGRVATLGYHQPQAWQIVTRMVYEQDWHLVDIRASRRSYLEEWSGSSLRRHFRDSYHAVPELSDINQLAPANPMQLLDPTTGQRMRAIPARQSAIPPQRTSAPQRLLPARRDEHEPLPLSRRGGYLHVHWLVYVGLSMFIMLLGWVALSTLGTWWQTTQDDWHYGHPRTFQIDAVVGHNNDSASNPSHFIAINLNRHILIIELPAGDASKAKIYSGPILLGQGQDLTPVTLSFKDVNGDGKPDMLVWVADSHFVFINDGGGFRPARSSEVLAASS